MFYNTTVDLPMILKNNLNNAAETNHVLCGWEPEDDIVSAVGTIQMHIGIEPSDILANALEIIYYSIDIIQA